MTISERRPIGPRRGSRAWRRLRAAERLTLARSARGRTEAA